MSKLKLSKSYEDNKRWVKLFKNYNDNAKLILWWPGLSVYLAYSLWTVPYQLKNADIHYISVYQNAAEGVH